MLEVNGHSLWLDSIMAVKCYANRAGQKTISPSSVLRGEASVWKVSSGFLKLSDCLQNLFVRQLGFLDLFNLLIKCKFSNSCITSCFLAENTNVWSYLFQLDESCFYNICFFNSICGDGKDVLDDKFLDWLYMGIKSELVPFHTTTAGLMLD